MTTRQQEQLAAVVAPLQSFSRWSYYQCAVTDIQRHWRGHLERAWLARRHAAATRIQAQWRRRDAMLYAQELKAERESWAAALASERAQDGGAEDGLDAFD